jgi:hypothetical protein
MSDSSSASGRSRTSSILCINPQRPILVVVPTNHGKPYGVTNGAISFCWTKTFQTDPVLT